MFGFYFDRGAKVFIHNLGTHDCGRISKGHQVRLGNNKIEIVVCLRSSVPCGYGQVFHHAFDFGRVVTDSEANGLAVFVTDFVATFQEHHSLSLCSQHRYQIRSEDKEPYPGSKWWRSFLRSFDICYMRTRCLPSIHSCHLVRYSNPNMNGAQ